MAKTYSGFTSTTAENLLLDAGAIFINYDMEVDTFDSAVAAGKLLGATRGGSTFEAVPEIRNIEIDGVKGRAKGLTVIDSWEVKLTANVLEVTKEGLTKALTSGSVDSITNLDYDIITASNDVPLSSYIDNITFVGKKSGSSNPVIIQLYNALNVTGLNIQTADKGETVIAMEFQAHYDSNELDSPPFKIFLPQNIA